MKSACARGVFAPQIKAWAPLVCLSIALTGCASGMDGLGYYWQSVSGHLALMRAARPVAEVLADNNVDGPTKEKLKYAQRARRFASQELKLPDNGSYMGYAQLNRSHVLWNVFATDELSLELKRWCFPVAGCIGYRGYYDKDVAHKYAAYLSEQGMDVQVGGVPAYSTLGWFDDPLPSTVIRFSPPQIARLIFHELAHQVVYVKGDSTFNESFATAVERAGMSRWLARLESDSGDESPRLAYDAARQRRRDFIGLLQDTRARLQAIYAGQQPDAQKLQEKAATFADMKSRYQQMKTAQWDGYAGYDRWFDRPLGNAHLAAVGAYNDLVPAFTAILDQLGGDLPAFYDRVRTIGALNKVNRDELLNRASPKTASTSPGNAS